MVRICVGKNYLSLIFFLFAHISLDIYTRISNKQTSENLFPMASHIRQKNILTEVKLARYCENRPYCHIINLLLQKLNYFRRLPSVTS